MKQIKTLKTKKKVQFPDGEISSSRDHLDFLILEARERKRDFLRRNFVCKAHKSQIFINKKSLSLKNLKKKTRRIKKITDKIKKTKNNIENFKMKCKMEKRNMTLTWPAKRD